MFGFYNWVTANCRKSPEKIAIINEDERVSYQELERRVNRLSYGMKQLGIGKGSRVAVLYHNEIDFVLVFLASLKLGAVFFPLNFRYIYPEIVDMLESIECEYFFCGSGFSEVAENLAKDHPDIVSVVSDAADNQASPKTLLDLMDNDQDSWDFYENVDPDDEILAIFTGGTTGKAKAAMHTQQSLVCQVIPRFYEDGELSGLGNDESYFCYMPLFHISGLSALTGMLASTNTLYLVKKLNVEDTLRIIEEERITQMFFIPPELSIRFMQLPDWEKYDLSSVRMVRVGGGNTTTEAVERTFQLFPNARVLKAYSNSEFFANISIIYTDESLKARPDLINALGKPIYFTETMVLNENDEIAKPNEPGILWGRSWGNMKRYFGQDAVEIDGYRSTGDVVYQDDEGYFYFVGRSKSLIKTGGENVYPAEVEEAIRQFPGIAECAIVGLPDPVLGEKVAAALVTLDDEAFNKEEFFTYCLEHMAGFKKPRKVFLIDVLPRTTIGKVDDATLLAQLTQMDSEGNVLQ